MAVGSSRVHAGHHREEGVVVDLAGEAEPSCAFAEPDAAGLARLQVVVRQLLDVVGAGVGALQRGHPDGHDHSLRVSVHSSVLDVPGGGDR